MLQYNTDGRQLCAASQKASGFNRYRPSGAKRDLEMINTLTFVVVLTVLLSHNGGK